MYKVIHTFRGLNFVENYLKKFGIFLLVCRSKSIFTAESHHFFLSLVKLMPLNLFDGRIVRRHLCQNG